MVGDGGRGGRVFCGPYAATGGEDPATDAVQVARDEAERGRRGGGAVRLKLLLSENKTNCCMLRVFPNGPII